MLLITFKAVVTVSMVKHDEIKFMLEAITRLITTQLFQQSSHYLLYVHNNEIENEKLMVQ